MVSSSTATNGTNERPSVSTPRATDASSPTSTTSSNDSSTSRTTACNIMACWPSLLLCCMIPVVVGLGAFFGLFVLPIVILACFGLSLFCMTSPSTTNNMHSQQQQRGENTQDVSTTKLSREEMQALLIPVVDSNNVEEDCEICLHSLMHSSSSTSPVVVVSPNPECNHVFHESCILEWLQHKPTCPCCRADYLCVTTPSGNKQENGANDNANGDQHEGHDNDDDNERGNDIEQDSGDNPVDVEQGHEQYRVEQDQDA